VDGELILLVVMGACATYLVGHLVFEVVTRWLL